MRSLYQLFTDHPTKVGETYLQHLVSAFGFAVAMILGGLACLVHAFLPFLFEYRGSDTIRALYDRMITNRSRLKSREVASSQPVA